MINFPNIKINLGLSIVEKRTDGFHNIESVFYPITYCDVLEIISSDTLQFTSSGIDIPGDASQNLCLKAYQLLANDFNLPLVHIHLHKVVPIGAGLGGGSSDAAFTLKMLNEKFSLNISTLQLEFYARKLGSDCAFFIENKPNFCFHKGDEFEKIDVEVSNYFFVIVYPGIHIATPLAYAGVKPKAALKSCKQIVLQPISTWKEELKNDFEDSIFPQFPAIKLIKESLYKRGALYASMSGSGSSVFGIFEQKTEITFPENYLIWKSWS